MIELGDKVKDMVTGFTGIVIAKTEWLNKCRRITVQSVQLQEGKPVTFEFDLEQLEVVEAGALRLEKELATGGPKDMMPTRPQVRR